MANGIDQLGAVRRVGTSRVKKSFTEAVATAKGVANHQAGRHWIGITSLGRHDDCVRKNPSQGGNKETLLRRISKPLPLAGVSF